MRWSRSADSAGCFLRVSRKASKRAPSNGGPLRAKLLFEKTTVNENSVTAHWVDLKRRPLTRAESACGGTLLDCSVRAAWFFYEGSSGLVVARVAEAYCPKAGSRARFPGVDGKQHSAQSCGPSTCLTAGQYFASANGVLRPSQKFAAQEVTLHPRRPPRQIRMAILRSATPACRPQPNRRADSPYRAGYGRPPDSGYRAHRKRTAPTA